MASEIIIGFEETPAGHDAVALGRTFATSLDASVLVAMAFPWPRGLISDEELEGALATESAEPLAAARAELAGVDASTEAVAARSAAQALAGLAESEDAALIVVGSAHRSKPGRLLLGTTSESLVHGAPCAIAVAPKGFADRETPTREARIGVAYDGSSEARLALEAAIGLAERTDSAIAVLTVADYPYYGYAATWSVLTAQGIHDFEREHKQRTLDQGLGLIPKQIESEGRLLTGSAGALLAEVSDEFSLLVAGSRGFGPLKRTLLGSSTRRLLASAACPVLILPRGADVAPFGGGAG